MRAHAGRRTEEGKAGVVAIYLPAREIQTGIGPVTVQIPKVRSKIRSRFGHPGTTVCEKDEITGSGPAVVIFERDIDGGVHEALQVLVGPECRPVGKHGIPLKQVWAEEYRDWNTEG